MNARMRITHFFKGETPILDLRQEKTRSEQLVGQFCRCRMQGRMQGRMLADDVLEMGTCSGGINRAKPTEKIY
jgi:hypothetical protein